jgi:hypothetical protein
MQAVVNGRRTSLQYERSIKAFLDLSLRHAKGPETAVNVDYGTSEAFTSSGEEYP